MIVNPLSSAYGAAASWRRRWYARDPRRVRRLQRPVISIGNVRAGGSGKTPMVAHIARLLHDRGERPAVLSRGYGRTRTIDGVTVVSDGSRILTGLATAGDEPLMLARALPGVIVCVGADRYLSGTLAEQTLGATIHLLDDGFQHVRLARTLDLVLIDEEDLGDRVLPAGRLREPIGNAAAADALLITAADTETAASIGRRLGVATTFRVTRTVGAPLNMTGGPLPIERSGPVLAFAGIARSERFFANLRSEGWTLADTIAFRDHYPYRQADVARIAERLRSAGASVALTTAKDAVRLSDLDLTDLSVCVAPLTVDVEPRDQFVEWLTTRVRTPR